MIENEISRVVVDAAIEVHRTLGGPGLLESVYEEALLYELELRGLKVERKKAVPVVYKGKRLASDLCIDLLVAGRVVVECKATSSDNPVFQAQALTGSDSWTSSWGWSSISASDSSRTASAES